MVVSDAPEQAGAVRDEITKLAVLGDVEGLRSAADRLPATVEAAYDRHRARALALALEGHPDSAVAELNAGAAAQLQSTSTLAADLAEIRLLSGDPGAAVEALALGLEDPTRAPRGKVGGAVAGAGAAFGALASRLGAQRPFDERFRIVAGTASLAAAVAALLLLPRSLDGRETAQMATELARPDQPRPSVVRVASPPAQAQGNPLSRAREAAEDRARGGGAALLSSDAGPRLSTLGSLRRTPGPSASLQPSRPAQPTRPAAPQNPPAQPNPTPAPEPTRPPAAVQTAQAAPSEPTRAGTQTSSGTTDERERGKNDKSNKKKKAKAANSDPANASGVSGQVPQGPPATAAEQQGGPPGQQPEDHDARGGGNDKDKDEKEKGPKK